jgi:hypothetical protein
MPPDSEFNDAAASGIPVQGDEWNGPWGSISPTPNSIETLCIQIDREDGKLGLYFFPYRTFGKWNWTMDQPETLEILAGGIEILISGMGLRRLAEALNTGQLRLVHEMLPPVLAEEIIIHSIRIEEVRN